MHFLNSIVESENYVSGRRVDLEKTEEEVQLESRVRRNPHLVRGEL